MLHRQPIHPRDVPYSTVTIVCYSHCVQPNSYRTVLHRNMTPAGARGHGPFMGAPCCFARAFSSRSSPRILAACPPALLPVCSAVPSSPRSLLSFAVSSATIQYHTYPASHPQHAPTHSTRRSPCMIYRGGEGGGRGGGNREKRQIPRQGPLRNLHGHSGTVLYFARGGCRHGNARGGASLRGAARESKHCILYMGRRWPVGYVYSRAHHPPRCQQSLNVQHPLAKVADRDHPRGGKTRQPASQPPPEHEVCI